VSEALDADQQLVLGGEEGLRGYPLRYHAGTSKALLPIEERYHTDRSPFRLLHVAGPGVRDTGPPRGPHVPRPPDHGPRARPVVAAAAAA